jgi:hypothetical protein
MRGVFLAKVDGRFIGAPRFEALPTPALLGSGPTFFNNLATIGIVTPVEVFYGVGCLSIKVKNF